MNKQQGGKKRQ